MAYSEATLPVPVPAETGLTAKLTLRVPDGARVYLQGKMVAAPEVRTVFESPYLKPGESYSFDVRVVWQEKGKDVEEKRTVTAEAGEHKNLTYFAAR